MGSEEYPDAGSVTINLNTIQACISADDGGGLRFLNAGLSYYHVHHNIITHNIAMHEGGGVSINDAPFVSFTDNGEFPSVETSYAACHTRTNMTRAPQC